MQELYEKIPDIRVALKLKILAQIRAEVGQDEVVHQQPEAVGVDVPPRAQTYEEWLRQNRLAAGFRSSATVCKPPRSITGNRI